MAEYHKTCAHCGAGFVAKLARARFCGRNCKNRDWRQNHPDIVADRNRKQYQKRPRHHIDRARECECCGVNFVPGNTLGRFCSSRCRARAIRSRDPEKARNKAAAEQRDRRKKDPMRVRKEERERYWRNRERRLEQIRMYQNEMKAAFSIFNTMQLINQFKEESKHD